MAVNVAAEDHAPVPSIGLQNRPGVAIRTATKFELTDERKDRLSGRIANAQHLSAIALSASRVLQLIQAADALPMCVDRD